MSPDAGFAELSVGGHFIAASGVGVTCSELPIVGAEAGGSI